MESYSQESMFCEEKIKEGSAPQLQIRPILPLSCTDESQNLTPVLQNVVSTVNLACRLNLRKITFCTRNSEYNPARFSGVVMRICEPHTTALVFSSGKMVVTGAKTESDANLAARKYARIIQKLGFDVKFLQFKIQNIVGTYDMKFPIRVEMLHQRHGQFCRYEPELFPGLIYRMVKPRVVLLIFVNGKIVMTGSCSSGNSSAGGEPSNLEWQAEGDGLGREGRRKHMDETEAKDCSAKCRQDLDEALRVIHPVLKSFKKD